MIQPESITVPCKLIRLTQLCLLIALSNLLLGFASIRVVAQELQQTDLEILEDFVSSNCVDCHHADEPAGGVNFEAFNFQADQFRNPAFDSQPWERILKRLDTRQMPPPQSGQPGEAEYEAISLLLADLLDDRASQFPRPGNVAALRRLTRLEYRNSVRDLLNINVDAGDYLPLDPSSHGFDNITVSELSPTHLNRYLTASDAISRAAIGSTGNGPVGITIRQPADRSQETRVDGLPFGTRGGILVNQHIHRSGEYEIALKLTRDRDEKVEGLFRKHPIDVLIDRKRVYQFEVKPVKHKGNWEEVDHTHVDTHLVARIPIEAGNRSIGVTFPKTFSSLTDDKRQPFDANFNRHRHPRRTPAIYQLSIVGPFDDGEPGETGSRQQILGDLDTSTADRNDAESILRRLARHAYRRPVNEEDVALLLPFYDRGHEEGGFEKGIELALTALLVNPNFLFRTERSDPKPIDAEQPAIEPALVGDHDLASRLSYFIWSSLPDNSLLSLADSKSLQDQTILRREAERMLADPRSEALIENFANQWLYLRNLDSITPDLRMFPDFDDNLRQAFAQETKSLFRDVLRNGRSVMKLIDTDTTWLNERLATHYGIRGVKGSEFRPVALPVDSHRGGILRHGSILMVTSYATRTSPTIRGNWILENIVGTPAAPPPPNVPNLKENTATEVSSVRERLAAHRANPACASCHDLMDPLGFALENFDAVGRWRQYDGTLEIDSQGQLPDGTTVGSVDELESGITARPAIFATTVTEKLMTYALGRDITSNDAPAIRRIVRDAEHENYSLRSLITGIVLSDPFPKRSTFSP